MPFTARPSTAVSSQRPSGIPASVPSTSQPALRTWITRKSCTTTIAATVMDTRTASGAAIWTGRRSARSGTATSASPNPKVERINVARKTTATTWRRRTFTTASPYPRELGGGRGADQKRGARPSGLSRARRCRRRSSPPRTCPRRASSWGFLGRRLGLGGGRSGGGRRSRRRGGHGGRSRGGRRRGRGRGSRRGGGRDLGRGGGGRRGSFRAAHEEGGAGAQGGEHFVEGLVHGGRHANTSAGR